MFQERGGGSLEAGKKIKHNYDKLGPKWEDIFSFTSPKIEMHSGSYSWIPSIYLCIATRAFFSQLLERSICIYIYKNKKLKTKHGWIGVLTYTQ